MPLTTSWDAECDLWYEDAALEEALEEARERTRSAAAAARASKLPCWRIFVRAAGTVAGGEERTVVVALWFKGLLPNGKGETNSEDGVPVP